MKRFFPFFHYEVSCLFPKRSHGQIRNFVHVMEKRGSFFTEFGNSLVKILIQGLPLSFFSSLKFLHFSRIFFGLKANSSLRTRKSDFKGQKGEFYGEFGENFRREVNFEFKNARL